MEKKSSDSRYSSTGRKNILNVESLQTPTRSLSRALNGEEKSTDIVDISDSNAIANVQSLETPTGSLASAFAGEKISSSSNSSSSNKNSNIKNLPSSQSPMTSLARQLAMEKKSSNSRDSTTSSKNILNVESLQTPTSSLSMAVAGEKKARKSSGSSSSTGSKDILNVESLQTPTKFTNNSSINSNINNVQCLQTPMTSLARQVAIEKNSSNSSNTYSTSNIDILPPRRISPLKTAIDRVKEKEEKKKICRFYSTSRGCRFGDKCRFSHTM